LKYTLQNKMAATVMQNAQTICMGVLCIKL
jgi:hypothetical protein